MANEKINRWRLSMLERRTLLILGDLVVGVIALLAALALWATDPTEWLGFSVTFFQKRVDLWFYLLPLIWLVLLIEIQDVHRAANWRKTLSGVGSSAAIGLFLYLIIYFASQNPLPRFGVAAFLIFASLLTLLWRVLYIRIFTSAQFLRRVLLVGAGEAGKTLLSAVEALDPKPFEFVGIIDDNPQKLNSVTHGLKVVAASESLLEIVAEEKITDIIVAISGAMEGQTFQTLLDAQHLGVEIIRMPVSYEELLGRVPINILEADWLLRSFIDQFRVNRFYRASKRLLDIIGGLVGVMILGLLLPFVGTATLLDSGRPIFYSQVRLGKGGQPFNIIKFRTMRQDAEEAGKPILAREDDDRATRIGNLLRKTHLDEVPQVVNVLRGEMSLVGPRSERPGLVKNYLKQIPFYRARLLVKPGITGWAQVNYGYAGNLEETKIKLEYDLYYIKHRNLALDLITLLRTPGTVIGMRGQ